MSATAHLAAAQQAPESASAYTDTATDTMQLDPPLIDDTFAAPLNQPASPVSHRATVENVPDEGDSHDEQRFYQYYTGEAATTFGAGRTRFEEMEREDLKEKRKPWAPYKSREEWELARFLAKNLGHNKIEEFLKLDIVSRYYISVLIIYCCTYQVMLRSRS